MEHRFQTSRLTRGNTIFPTVLVVSDRYVTRIKPSLAGRVEESISLRQVSSVTVSQGAIFADVTVHSSGGTDPLRSHGHTNAEAMRLKSIIEDIQTNLLTAGVPDVSHLRPCPRCAETIKVAAQVCRHCAYEIPIELTEEVPLPAPPPVAPEAPQAAPPAPNAAPAAATAADKDWTWS